MILYEFNRFYVEFSLKKYLQVSIVGKQCRLWSFGKWVSRSTASRSSSCFWLMPHLPGIIDNLKKKQKQRKKETTTVHKCITSWMLQVITPHKWRRQKWSPASSHVRCPALRWSISLPAGPEGRWHVRFRCFFRVWFGLDHRMILQHPKSFDLDVMSERVFQAMTSNWIIWKGLVHFHISIVLLIRF